MEIENFWPGSVYTQKFWHVYVSKEFTEVFSPVRKGCGDATARLSRLALAREGKIHIPGVTLWSRMSRQEGARRIRKVLPARPTIEGAGVHLRRAFGFAQAPGLDPFLLLDDFRSNTPADYLPGFPWHPHRGIETITYILGGSVEHGDSMGNRGTIHPGDVQWMTAGSGIIHQEMPKGDPHGMLCGFQLWANLPARLKMTDPRYRGVEKTGIPVTSTGEGITVRVIAGDLNGIRGPVRDIAIDPSYLDVSVPPETAFVHEIPAGHTVFAYVVTGSGRFDQGEDPFAYEIEGRNYFDLNLIPEIEAENLVLYGDGDRVVIRGGKSGVRFLLVSGRPIGEPVAWYGPIVMNTREELRIAFEELQNGLFVKYKG